VKIFVDTFESGGIYSDNPYWMTIPAPPPCTIRCTGISSSERPRRCPGLRCRKSRSASGESV